ncbi:MAG: ABC transporter substrate-binding protein [Tissierellia bacterium]|nr:ABC transporter substrate-binding protein [Tissierellia bacterium]
MKKVMSLLLVISLIALGVVGCSGGSGGKGKIVFADAGWESNKFHNAVAGFIAEEVYGYTWSEVPGSTAVMHEGLIKDEIDIHMENWSDNIPSYAKDLADGKFQELGINFDDNYQGIYVPRYVIEGDEARDIEASAPDLKYVWDLKDYPDVFPDDEEQGKGRIYGAIPGWEVDEIMHRKYLHYGLDDNFVYFRPGSDTALQTAIISAYDRGEPIAAYYWEPTWLLGLYDMVLLDDEPFDEGTYLDGETELPAVKVTVSTSNNFAEDENNKEMVKFLSNYSTSSDLTSQALGYMQETDSDYTDTARWFLKEHDELLDEWLDPEDAEALRQILND